MSEYNPDLHLDINKIYQGDCLELMNGIPDKSVDMVLCDLPYGTTACKWDTIIPFDKLWNQYERVIKDNGAIVLFGSQPFTTTLINSNIKLFKYCWYWEKEKGTGFAFSGKQPLRKIEEICVFYKKQPTYNPQMTEGKPYTQKRLQESVKGIADNMGRHTTKSDGKRYPKSIIRVEGQAQRHITHPTQKPVSLFEYLIKTYTNEGETVLDNCMGSGTTAIACLNTKRNFIGFELNEEYYNMSLKRISENE